MVFCSECGSENSDDAEFCVKCGEKLILGKEKRKEEWGEEFGKKMEKWGENFGKRMEERGEEFGKTIENECFGLPHGGAIIGIIFGAFIIIVGASLLMGLNFEVWGRLFGTGILILIGLIIVIGAIYGLTRKRS